MTAAIVASIPGMWCQVEGLRTRTTPAVATLAWHPSRPDEAELRIGRAIWCVDVHLVAAGLDGPAGMGDLFITPGLEEGRHEIVLDPGHGRGAHHCDTADLAAFVDAVRTAKAVAS